VMDTRVKPAYDDQICRNVTALSRAHDFHRRRDRA
jgi:hypothetical protein